MSHYGDQIRAQEDAILIKAFYKGPDDPKDWNSHFLRLKLAEGTRDAEELAKLKKALRALRGAIQ